MTNEAECPRRIHCAVYLDNCVIVFGGVGKLQAMSTCVIWMYNLYTEEWRKQVIAKQSDAPEPFLSAVAAAIDGTIYTFGGLLAESYNERNALWTLSKRSKGCFTWRFIKSRCNKESPSPRNGHTGWENGGDLWIFGGMGPSQEGYLNDHGDILDQVYNCNNQLLVIIPTLQNGQILDALELSPHLDYTMLVPILRIKSGCLEEVRTLSILMISLSSRCTL